MPFIVGIAIITEQVKENSFQKEKHDTYFLAFGFDSAQPPKQKKR